MDKKRVVRAVLDRINGIEWRFMFFDFNTQLGVCGVWPDGKRMAARFTIPHLPVDPEGKCLLHEVDDVLRLYPALVERAKDEVRQAVKAGRFVRDEILEGNEIIIH